MIRKAFIASILAALAAIPPAAAQDIKLPPTLSATAYDTGSSGFNVAVAVGKALKEKHNSDLRVLPAGNDVARLNPLRAGRAQFSAMGIGLYFAQEAVLEFAVKEWGPQPLQMMLGANSCNGIALGVAKDTGAQTVKDLKGKRVGTVVGSPALNQNAFGFLAFGGLTPSDVRLVEFSSFGAMWKGMMNNEVDAAAVSTITGVARELETSPRGLVWMATPHADTEGWARMNKVAPYFTKHRATCGAGGLSPQNAIEMPGYAYPMFVAYAQQDPELVYSITKAMLVNYPHYKAAAPGADGLAAERQTLSWVVPHHAGAVRALKEAGVWKAEHEAHNQKILKRQAVLMEAWTAFMKAPPADKEAFHIGWMSARKAALTKAGMDPVFE
ncbi:MAG: TAXI family TRAP transporter solute-binding subunit [Alphaproteobacteria bacterium]|nr:TAXI family TRAP transporter solute-binding subunit [Alphaproteobacteria bacterium]MCW5742544.1 TAXI family TRAP transporter solute-binding subunit [Alphaproteobacteria bacterium]